MLDQAVRPIKKSDIIHALHDLLCLELVREYPAVISEFLLLRAGHNREYLWVLVDLLSPVP